MVNRWFFLLPVALILVGITILLFPSPPLPLVEAQILLCAGGKYDFSSVIVPGEVRVDFRPDCISEVILPPAVVFRTDPSSDIKIVFIDGSQYIDGPGRQVWYGLKRGIFKMHGLKEAGVLKITLEKKT